MEYENAFKYADREIKENGKQEPEVTSKAIMRRFRRAKKYHDEEIEKLSLSSLSFDKKQRTLI